MNCLFLQLYNDEDNSQKYEHLRDLGFTLVSIHLMPIYQLSKNKLIIINNNSPILTI